MNEEHDMSPALSSGPEMAKAPSPSPSLAVFAKAAIATLLLVCAVATGIYATSVGPFRHGDGTSSVNAQAPLEAFHELDPSNLSDVAPRDVNRALQTMELDPIALQSLKAALQPDANAAPQSAGATSNDVQAAAQAKQRRVRLVWVTLWDADVQEGDVVRIDSEGYSRTVVLTKKGDTFAVPVSEHVLVRIIAVNDKDVAGTTLGLASGNLKSIFHLTARMN